jgi:ATP-dependent DNA helicase PIF1
MKRKADDELLSNIVKEGKMEIADVEDIADITDITEIAKVEEMVEDGLSKSQREVLGLVDKGCNLFVTGSAGTGKSFLIKKIVERYEGKGLCMLTASTGIAAWNIGGVTLHSFGGIGLGDMKIKIAIATLNKPAKKEKLDDWKAVKVLIIDEISMITVKYLSKLNDVAKLVRGCPLPFGGIQVIMVGDYFQCPSVEKDFVPIDPVTGKIRHRYPFQSPLWKELGVKSICLRENFRQSGDTDYFNLLERIKVAKITKDDEALLRTRLIKNHPEVKDTDLIKLCSRRADAELINKKALEAIDSPVHVFKGVVVNHQPSEKMNDKYPVDMEITLKKGAEVLLCYNMDTLNGLVNGSRGTIIDFRKDDMNDSVAYPFVQFESGFRELIKPHKYECIKKKRVTSSFTQVPLMLRYAVTIHKAQGLTLEKIRITMDFFEKGQGYVAFSRVKKLDDLFLDNVDISTLKCSQEVVDFYQTEGLLCLA